MSSIVAGRKGTLAVRLSNTSHLKVSPAASNGLEGGWAIEFRHAEATRKRHLLPLSDRLKCLMAGEIALAKKLTLANERSVRIPSAGIA